jgi:hypothetical protein
MSVIELYKEHINPNPSGSEIYQLLRQFDLNGILIFNPLDSRYNSLELRKRQENINRCKQYIFSQSIKKH